jgi:uncharacterized membrane protein
LYTSTMSKNRIEAFSDGVLAIIITIMVLELKVPHNGSLAALRPVLPVFLSYLLSFIYVGIYWNNHHHMFQGVKHINGQVLWANLHLLFWLSLIPFATAWMGENDFTTWPTTIYGVILFLAGFAYFILTRVLIASHGRDSAFATTIGSDWKEKTSMYVYIAAIPVAFLNSWLALALYILVALMWFIPDRRFEKASIK